MLKSQKQLAIDIIATASDYCGSPAPKIVFSTKSAPDSQKGYIIEAFVRSDGSNIIYLHNQNWSLFSLRLVLLHEFSHLLCEHWHKIDNKKHTMYQCEYQACRLSLFLIRKLFPQDWYRSLPYYIQTNTGCRISNKAQKNALRMIGILK